jgi:DNA-binding IclR family transcriptional regulator
MARVKPADSDSQGVQSIEVGGRLLRALASGSGPMMLRDIAAAAGMPAAKAHRYLASYARLGLVEQQQPSGHYDLGAFALELGLGALARIEPLQLAEPVLRELRDAIGQTVALAVWANHGATIVRWLGADTPVAASLRVGSVMPLTRSATGGAFLAWLPEAQTRALLRAELEDNRRLGLEPATLAAVQRAVTAARRHGCTRTSHFIAGISGIAAPVFGHGGELQLALVALGYSATLDLAPQGPHVSALRQRAAALSARLGHRPDLPGAAP